MSKLFKSQKAAVPVAPSPVPLPPADEAALRRAKARALRGEKPRSGRLSTLMSDGGVASDGGAYLG